MNKEEAKQKLHNLAFAKLDTKPDDLKLADVMQIVNQIDEPQAGQAEQAPRYVKNILARLRELPLHDREVWLKAIMGEFEKDFSHAKWREGHEVEKEKKYKITLLNRNDGDLYLINQNADLADKYGHFSPVVLLFTKGTNFSEKCYKLTKKEVVLNDFGWVFDCPGIKIEEVKDE